MGNINAGLVGISGYAGMELARLLAVHPDISLAMACSRAEAGRRLGDFYPFLRQLPGSDIEITSYEAASAASCCDMVFLAVPAGTAMNMAPELLARGVKVIDLSADFRIKDQKVFEKWYNMEHAAGHLLGRSVYGLPELYEFAIAKSDLIANPGCYPTASILALYAALKNDVIEPENIIIDAKSGASGAGRKAAIPTLFCEVSDNFRPYGVPSHRHTPEIEQELSNICSKKLTLTFTPHIVPMKRGILVTCYAKLKNPAITLETIQKIYEDTWQNAPWVRVLPLGELPETAHVRGSMFCDIALNIDKRNNRLLVFGAIDNLCRGASGQALANANLMCGLPLTTGMENLAPLP